MTTEPRDVVFGYEKLEVYGLSIDFVAAVYGVIEKYPSKERFRLTSQAARSASSVTLNIAEGSGRAHKRDFARFVRTSIGSLFETMANLELGKKLHYIDDEDIRPIRARAEKVYFKLIALEKYLLREQSG
jgi:four helix bundle protein